MLQQIEEDNERRKNLEIAASVVFDLFFEIEELEDRRDYDDWSKRMTDAILEMGEYIQVKTVKDWV